LPGIPRFPGLTIPGVTDPNERWGTSPSSFPVDETIRRIETAGAWIAIKRAEHDPAYAKLLADCMSDVLEVSGHELERNMRYKKVDVFVTSPKRVTTYHIDSESGFLLQIAGSKEQVPRPRPLLTHQPVPL
jgi:hypothetical protein